MWMIPSQKFSNYTRSERDWFTERLSMHLSSNTELHIRVIYNWKLGLTLTLSLSSDSLSVHFLSWISSANEECLASTGTKKKNNNKKITIIALLRVCFPSLKSTAESKQGELLYNAFCDVSHGWLDAVQRIMLPNYKSQRQVTKV